MCYYLHLTDENTTAIILNAHNIQGFEYIIIIIIIDKVQKR